MESHKDLSCVLVATNTFNHVLAWPILWLWFGLVGPRLLQRHPFTSEVDVLRLNDNCWTSRQHLSFDGKAKRSLHLLLSLALWACTGFQWPGVCHSFPVNNSSSGLKVFNIFTGTLRMLILLYTNSVTFFLTTAKTDQVADKWCYSLSIGINRNWNSNFSGNVDSPQTHRNQ